MHLIVVYTISPDPDIVPLRSRENENGRAHVSQYIGDLIDAQAPQAHDLSTVLFSIFIDFV